MDAFVFYTLVVAGAWFALFAAFSIWKRFWLETPAVVTKAFASRVLNAERKKVRTFNVEYTYVVDGIRYPGSGYVQVDVPYHLEDDALSELAVAFKPGEVIGIFRPKSVHQISAIRRSGGLTDVLCAIFFLMVLVVGSYLFLSQLARSHHRRPNQRPAPTTPAVMTPAAQEAGLTEAVAHLQR